MHIWICQMSHKFTFTNFNWLWRSYFNLMDNRKRGGNLILSQAITGKSELQNCGFHEN